LARKILLADDSVTAQNMGRKILADAGYEVFAVNNGSAALKKIAELRPDLVILDVYMPGYSGLEVCQRLKESQDTARIPVLLTVGKLEPFKPEEAQRVRAEGYIVKPFEASELLSALSKLEDKVVPRAEPSKGGRFARALAATEGTETGWKTRIAFPPKKTETEETFPEEIATANREGEKASAEKEKPKATEPSIDLAALAGAGLPKDVTPSEVAAITAAAAQMQMAEATRNEHRSTDDAVSQAAAQTTGEFPVEPALERFEDKRADEIQRSSTESNRPVEAEARGDTPSNLAKNAVVASSEPPASELDSRRKSEERPEEAQDAPVTMAVAHELAAAASVGSNWAAVPIALGEEEASLSLDHEMQKAYAAFAAADYATGAGAIERESASQPTASVPSETAIKPQASSTTEPAAVSKPQPAPEEIRSESVAPPHVPSPVEKPAAVSEFVAAARDTEIRDHVSAMPAAPETQPASEASIVSTDISAPIAATAEPQFDSETVKTTAAAWASWGQGREVSKGDDPQRPQEVAAFESAVAEMPSADAAALAVAAGAERAMETIAPAPEGNPADVASIVDSVLAGLRPKLMEEISRKMAEKK